LDRCEVSVVGLGCNNFGWRIDADASAAAVNAALDAGINFFDTADIYGAGQSEEFLGRALGARRGEVLIATKFGMKMDEQRRGARPEYVRQAAEDSLRRLGTDRIDLYQLHQPDRGSSHRGNAGRAGRAWCAPARCARLAVRISRAINCARRRRPCGKAPRAFVSVQNQYSLVHREPEADVIPECVRAGIAFLPLFPVGQWATHGQVSPRPAASRRQPRAGWIRSEGVHGRESGAGGGADEFAAGHGHTMLELAVSWLAAQPAVASVIAGAKSPEQVKANASAAGWRLTKPIDLAAIEGILTRSLQAR
jgi:aryl-alcohol dehydrogenase-like predicted oxidoreductase